jgi:chitin synthase
MDSSGYMTPRQRHDSNTLLMLPAPLAVNSRAPTSLSPIADIALNTRLPPTPQTDGQLKVMSSDNDCSFRHLNN